MILIKHSGLAIPHPSNARVDLQSLEKIVGGSVDLVSLSRYTKSQALQQICLVIKDDSAKDNKSKENLQFGNTILYGTVVACGYNPDGSLRDLNNKETIAVDKFLCSYSISDRAFHTPTDLFGEPTR